MEAILILFLFLYLSTSFIHNLTYSEKSLDENWENEVKLDDEYLRNYYTKKYTRRGYSANEITDKVEKKLLKIKKEAYSSRHFSNIFYIIFTIFALFITYIIIISI
tara:strand:+ start:47 stop:364 length:318 start_codon:yes stop_codon:yes gene_type:complete